MFLGVAETIAASILCCGVGIVQCLQRHLVITPIDNTLKVLFKPGVCLHTVDLPIKVKGKPKCTSHFR